MALVELIHTYYGYNAWANGRILDTTEHLSPDQFIAKIGASFDSVRDTLVHTMNVQKNWLARCQHQPLDLMLEFGDFADLRAIRQMWAEIEAATQKYIAALDENGLVEIVNYVNSRGEDCAYPCWQMLLHQVNHATQHRSEVAVMLTQFGHSPGWLDFLVYIDSLN